MNKIRFVATATFLALLSVPPAQATGRILGIFKDGVYTNHEKLFTVQSPFPGEPGQIFGKPAWIAVAYLPGGSPLGRQVHGEDELVHGDSWRVMAVVTQGERFYLLMTELRAEALATKDWTYDRPGGRLERVSATT